MDISLNWVNRYVQCDDIEPAKLAQMVTNVGLEVEGMHALAYGTKLVVGYVKSCQCCSRYESDRGFTRL